MISILRHLASFRDEHRQTRKYPKSIGLCPGHYRRVALVHHSIAGEHVDLFLLAFSDLEQGRGENFFSAELRDSSVRRAAHDILGADDFDALIVDHHQHVAIKLDAVQVAEFGEEGYEPGQFYEPVGLALDAEGILYVADTWNQRIQSFDPDGSGSYMPSSSWDIYGWYGQSLDNKPFLAADDQIHIFAGDPEGVRVLEFNNQGEIVRYWGDYSVGSDGFALVGGIAIDPSGGVWVADTGNSRIMHFNLP